MTKNVKKKSRIIQFLRTCTIIRPIWIVANYSFLSSRRGKGSCSCCCCWMRWSCSCCSWRRWSCCCWRRWWSCCCCSLRRWSCCGFSTSRTCVIGWPNTLDFGGIIYKTTWTRYNIWSSMGTLNETM